jgi:hypothetical protein
MAIRLGHERLHRGILVGLKVRPGGRGNSDVALEDAPSLPSRDLPDGIVAPLTYDAGRKALAAVLGNEGLRPTSAGGHLAPELSAADVREDVPKVQAILDLAIRVLDGMSPF